MRKAFLLSILILTAGVCSADIIKDSGVAGGVVVQIGIDDGKEPFGAFNMEGVTSDIMSSEGDAVCLKYMKFDKDGNELKDDKLVVAGPVDLRKKSARILAYDNEEDALASYKGEKGVMMQIISTADGKVLSEQKLDSVPAFDGMIAANGMIIVSLKNGMLECYK